MNGLHKKMSDLVDHVTATLQSDETQHPDERANAQRPGTARARHEREN